MVQKLSLYGPKIVQKRSQQSSIAVIYLHLWWSCHHCSLCFVSLDQRVRYRSPFELKINFSCLAQNCGAWIVDRIGDTWALIDGYWRLQGFLPWEGCQSGPRFPIGCSKKQTNICARIQSNGERVEERKEDNQRLTTEKEKKLKKKSRPEISWEETDIKLGSDASKGRAFQVQMMIP